MTSDLANRARDLFGLALEQDPASRKAFLDEHCAGDELLRKEVDSLLIAHQQSESFLEPPARQHPPEESQSAPLTETSASSTQTATPDRALPENLSTTKTIGRFRILGVLGEGGMGVVYDAQQQHPRRRVALKVLKAGLATRPAMRRFVHEANILGRLRHPGIAQVFDAGSHGGTDALELPYFAMEYIQGARTITQFAEDEHLSTRQRLDLIARVCDAVHHGHQRGVIHRDLKPGNILVDKTGQTKVIDFGVARATDADMTIATLQTDVGQLIGTLRYMSPEQCEGDSAEIDTRCDVYALGVVLYELLTGQLPYDFTSTSPFEIPRVIREVEPHRLSSINRALRGDVETIACKALEKDPGQRYQSALDLARDIRRYLDNEPIEAKRHHAGYVLRKTLARHKAAVGVVCAIALLVTGSAVGFAILYRIAETHRIYAEEQKTFAEQQRYVAEQRAEALRHKDYLNCIALAQNAYESANVIQLNELLNRCPEDLRGWEWNFLHGLSDESVMTIHGHKGLVGAVAYSPDGHWILSAGREDKTLKLWDASTGALIRTLTGHETMVASITFSPDGTRIASGGFDGDGKVRVWDTATGAQVLTLPGHKWTIKCVAFTPDGRRIVTGASLHEHRIDATLKVWDSATGDLLAELEGHEDDVISLAISSDGATIASGGTDSTIKLWDAESGREMLTIPAHDRRVECLAFSPDGRRIFSGSRDKLVKVWEAETGELLMTFPKHDSEVFDLALAPEGQRLASSSRDSIQIWDVESGQRLRRLLGHEGYIRAVGFSPDGSRIVSGSSDGTIKAWDALSQEGVFTLACYEGKVHSLCCSPDGRWIVAGGRDNLIHLYDAQSGEELAAFQGHRHWVDSLAFSPDGTRLVSACHDGTAKVWDVPGGAELLTLRVYRREVRALAWSPDPAASGLIATGSMDHSIKIWSADTAEIITSIIADDKGVSSVAFSPDGSRLVSGGLDHMVKIWDIATGDLIEKIAGHTHFVESVAYSPDGTRIASGGQDWSVRIWDADTGQNLHILKGHRGAVENVAFSPDGRRIVSASWDTTLKVWDAATGQLALTLRGHEYPVVCAAFTPDGRRIVSGGHDKTVKVWDAGKND